MHEIKMFDRSGALSLEDFEGSGADWVDPLGKYIGDGETIVTDMDRRVRDVGRQ